MGKTARRGDAALNIHHERPSTATYSPGDTIIGHVSRSQPTVSPSVIVRITLCGRTKSKIVISRGNNNKSYYRGRFTVIDEVAHWQKIYEGPVHIANQTPTSAATGPAVWPFAIDIPAHCSPKVVRSVPAEQSYLPLDTVSVAACPIPDTFEMDHPGWGTHREGFVEYFLKATISYTQSGSHKSKEAYLPISIRGTNPEPPIVDFKLRRHRRHCMASTFRLLPGMENAELSFTQKRQELVGSSKVPTLAGELQMDVPQVLQLENPNHVPVLLRFIPNTQGTSSGMRGIPAKIALRSLKATIASTTTVLCDGTFSPHEASDTNDSAITLWPHRPNGLTGRGPEPFYIPCTDEWPPIDIGERVGFRIPDYLVKRTVGPNARSFDLLNPDFTTFNIKHGHSIKFDLVADVAGREIKMSSFSKLTILPAAATAPAPQAESSVAQQQQQAEEEEAAPPPPFQPRSESWIHPPAEADAPPTFAEVQKDDMKRKSFDGRGDPSTSANGETS